MRETTAAQCPIHPMEMQPCPACPDGYSGPCPKPPLPRVPTALREKVLAKVDEWGIGGERELALAVAALVAEECAKECESERVDADASGADDDRVYNAACDHCAAAIRRSAEGLR